MIAKGTRMLLTIVLLLGAVYTQAENVPFIKVSIPFDFTAGTQPLPAGDYTISDSAVYTQSVIWLKYGFRAWTANTSPRCTPTPDMNSRPQQEHSSSSSTPEVSIS